MGLVEFNKFNQKKKTRIKAKFKFHLYVLRKTRFDHYLQASIINVPEIPF